MEPDLSLLYRMYDAFNSRDADAAIANMTDDVEWPRAFKGGCVKGHDAVRDYWTQQWAEIDPRVLPVGYLTLPDQRLRLDVRQTVRDLEGNLLSEGIVGHVYAFRDGLVAKMEVDDGEGKG